MRISFVVGAAVGYVLGARAGRERYESIVRFARKIAGSQTVQSTAGVLQAQVDSIATKGRALVTSKLTGGRQPTPARASGVNGQRR